MRLSVNHHYCPLCFAEIPVGSERCPACGRDIEYWERHTPYFERLLWALHNPHSEVRMGAILSLQHQGRAEAAEPLADCAMRFPVDVVQGLAVVDAITQLPESPEKQRALQTLQSHAAHSVRNAAEKFCAATNGE
ncbi:HEAT repeat domain-containing protein [Acidithiobacillus sp. IBUN Pt1247-S3]|uniref:HEAT repeat domain-containing protein n=1 Tax=Acidithiobacillus sp. IBUN Pt1247-S3 TaxID=3166642 RepID=UPI0034E61086